MWPFMVRAEPESEEPDKTEQDSGAEDALLQAMVGSEIVTKAEAMNIPTFAACVNKISEAISIIPIKLYKVVGDAVEEVSGDERVRLLNDETGDALNAVQLKRAIVRDYLTGKGGYVYINRSGKKVKSLHYVKENEISFIFSSDPIFKDYDIMVQGNNYKPFDFIKILRNTDNGRDGKSLVDENNKVLSVAYNSLKYEENLVRTGGNKKGFIKSPKKLSNAAIAALRSAWRRLYRNNDENVVVLNEGLEFQESSNTSVEMQLNENKKSNSDEICKICNMSPAILCGGASEQDRIDLVQCCLIPILKELECALNKDLLLESEKGSYFYAADTSEMTKGDIEKRFRAYATAGKNGFMQIDEIRRKENMPSLGLDFVRLGLQDVLYDPNTKQFYTPNMNATGSINPEAKKEGETVNENRIEE